MNEWGLANLLRLVLWDGCQAQLIEAFSCFLALGSQSAHIQNYAFRNLKQQNWTSHLLSSVEATDGRFTLCSCSFKGSSCHGCSQCSANVRTLCLMVVAYHVPRRTQLVLLLHGFVVAGVLRKQMSNVPYRSRIWSGKTSRSCWDL